MSFDQLLARLGQVRTLSPGDHVFRAGDADRNLYFVKDGLLKAYYVSAQGRETVKSFIVDGSLIGSLTSAYLEQACSFSLVCLEPTTLITLPFAELREASRSDLEVATAVTDFLLRFALRKERRERELLSLSADERYALMCEESPDLVNRLRQKDIARYLGITPVALSRIRGRQKQESDGPQS